MAHPEPDSAPQLDDSYRPWLTNPATVAMLPDFDDVDHQAVDDCVSGVRLRRANSWKAATKIVRCNGAPYFEYGELAASCITACTPQHLRMLRVVDDNDPANPAVHWNKGHLLYQITYALGPVNFYFRWGGESVCVPLEEGDSLFSLPFLPHSFASRGKHPACALVLSYPGSLVGSTRHELSALGYEAARGFAMVPGSDSYGALLWSFLDALAMPPAELRQRTDLSGARVAAILAGESDPLPAELASLAAVLNVNVRDLLPPRTHTHNGVQVVRTADAASWMYPDAERPAYAVTRLAGDPLHPYTTALELRVLDPGDREHVWLMTHQHQYLYVLGQSTVRFRWHRDGGQYVTKLHPGDTAYVQPGVPIRFGVTTGPSARLVLLRTAHTMSPDLRFAVGAMSREGLQRYCGPPTRVSRSTDLLERHS